MESTEELSSDDEPVSPESQPMSSPSSVIPPDISHQSSRERVLQAIYDSASRHLDSDSLMALSNQDIWESSSMPDPPHMPILFSFCDRPCSPCVLLTRSDKRKKKEVRGIEAKSERFEKAIEAELASLRKYEVYEEVTLPFPFPKNLPIVTSRFVLTDKPATSNSPARAKARLVARGFQEPDKENISCRAPTASCGAWKLVLSLLVHFQFPPRALDVSTAFLQGMPLDRLVYVVPPPQVTSPPGLVWKLRQALYGLIDAPEKWHRRVVKIFVDQLKGTQSRIDPAIFYWSCEGSVV
jgi:hypothetical protein